MEIVTKEQIRKFLNIDEFPTDFGYGDGDGAGAGLDNGVGYGDDAGSGYESGSGFGYGSCYYYDKCDSKGYGCSSEDIRRFNGQEVYAIDRVCTLITSVHTNYAKGYILESDFTTTPCYIAKCGNYFAHGETLKEAFHYAREKYNENLPVEQRIVNFNKKFPDRDKKVNANKLFYWHHILTGSCLIGRQPFAETEEWITKMANTLSMSLSTLRRMLMVER